MKLKDLIRLPEKDEIRKCLTDVVKSSIILGKPASNLELAVVWLSEIGEIEFEGDVEKVKELFEKKCVYENECWYGIYPYVAQVVVDNIKEIIKRKIK